MRTASVMRSRSDSWCLREWTCVTRITSGKLYLRKERIDAASVVLAALDDLRPLIESKGITLRSTLERDVTLYADPTRIQQIAWNLLSNAASPSQVPPVSASWQDTRLDGMRILIVDDDEDGCEILSMALSSLGAIAESATHALGALESIARSVPDILVCDIGMPDIDGFGLIALVRALPSPSRSTTPAIAVSGFARQEDQERARSAGFAAHLPKPVDLGRLVATILRFARRA